MLRPRSTAASSWVAIGSVPTCCRLPGLPGQDLGRRRAVDEAAEDHDAPAADRDDGEPGRRRRQVADRRDADSRRGGHPRRGGRAADDLRRQELDPVRLREVAVRRRGDARVAVLPDDLLRARVDQDHAVVVVVVRGDHPVRQPDGERRLVEHVRRRSSTPNDHVTWPEGVISTIRPG